MYLQTAWHQRCIVMWLCNFWCLKCVDKTFNRWHSPKESLVWWRRRMSWASSATVRLLSSSSTAPTSCFSTPAPTWTTCCWNTLSTTNRTRAAPIKTSLRQVSNVHPFLRLPYPTTYSMARPTNLLIMPTETVHHKMLSFSFFIYVYFYWCEQPT